MNSLPDEAQPIATVAADLDIPLTTLRRWVNNDDLAFEMRKQGRTRVCYLPVDTIQSLRKRKGVEEPPVFVPFVPDLPKPAAEIVLPPLPTENHENRYEPAPAKHERGRSNVLPFLLSCGWKLLRAVLAIHTTERTAEWFLGPEPFLCQAQSMRPMKLRRR